MKIILFIPLLLIIIQISCKTIPSKESAVLPQGDTLIGDTTAEASIPYVQTADTITEAKKIRKDKVFELPRISAVKATFPLRIYRLNFNSRSNTISPDEKVRSIIEQEIRKVYFLDCNHDSSEEYGKMKEVYFNTICLKDSLQTIFLVITHCNVHQWIGSTAFFYDNITSVALKLIKVL